MAATERVTIVTSCPHCGRDCTWNGSYRDGGGTKWVILCDYCQDHATHR